MKRYKILKQFKYEGDIYKEGCFLNKQLEPIEYGAFGLLLENGFIEEVDCVIDELYVTLDSGGMLTGESTAEVLSKINELVSEVSKLMSKIK